MTWKREKVADRGGHFLRKRHREEDEMSSPGRRAVPRKRRRVEDEINSTERGAVLRKRRREEDEMYSPERGEVPRKRSREEDEISSPGRSVVLRKRCREEDKMNSPERGEVPRKRSREEDEISSPGRRVVLRKRCREEDKMNSPERGEVPRKRSREEDEISSPGRRVVLRKRCREEDKMNSPERGEVPRKRSREEEVENSAERNNEVSRNGSGEELSDSLAEILRNFIKDEEDEIAWNCLEDLLDLSKEEKQGSREEDVNWMTSGHRAEHIWASPGSLSPESFIFHKVLGEGGFGKVVLATHRDTDILVAIKIVRKSFAILYSPQILVERQVMEMVGNNPFFTHTYATFETESHLFYVMEFLKGGDLFDWLVENGTCDLNSLRLLAAELVCGLQFLHSRGVVHRDLKPDNILLEHTGHVKYADFGLAATDMFGSNTRSENVGTKNYQAPKVIKCMPYDQTVDYFSLGIVLFEMAFWDHPFSESDVSNSILNDLPNYPEDADPDLVAFLDKFLCKDLIKRREAIANIRDDPFFQGINWEELERGHARPPLFVQQKSLRKITKNTMELEELRGLGTTISAEEQTYFNGFSFVSDKWRAIQKLN